MHFNRSLGRGLKILTILNAGGEHSALLLYRDDAQKCALPSYEDIEAQLAEIRHVGYACMHRPGGASDRSSLAGPVRAGGDMLASLVVRYARSAVKQHIVMERFLPALRQTSHAIAAPCERAAV